MTDKTPDSNIIAKLHDLLKLSGDSELHSCPDKCADKDALKQKNPLLWQALKHHCVFRSKTSQHQQFGCQVDIDRNTLYVSLADHKASAISRRLKGGMVARDVYRVWRDEGPVRGEVEADTSLLERAFAEEDLESFYGECLPAFEKQAETRSNQDGSPFTSLRTHAELTGNWYDFFASHPGEYPVPDSMEDTRAIFRTGIMETRVLLLRLKVRTHGRLARLKDLQIIREIVKKKDDIAEALDGALLYNLPDEVVVAAVPSVLAKLDGMLGAKISSNYFIEFAPAESNLRNPNKRTENPKTGFLHNFGALFGGFPSVIYPDDLKPVILQNDATEAGWRAIICDLCQMAPATKTRRETYKDRNEQVDEYLCESCYDMRGRADGVDLFARLEKDEDARVCLVKVSLDMAQLVTVLEHVFEERVKPKKKKLSAGEQDLGFSILHEFVRDYYEFLRTFEAGILDLKQDYREDHYVLLPGFIVVGTKEDGELAEIVRLYERLYSKSFRYLTGRELELPKSDGEPIFPVKLSVSCSPVKYPFLEHWEVLDNPKSAINVQSVRRAALLATFRDFDVLEGMGLRKRQQAGNGRDPVSSFLHNLAEIEARTQSMKLVKFAIHENYRRCEAVAGPVMDGKVTADQVLNYYKLFAHERAT